MGRRKLRGIAIIMVIGLILSQFSLSVYATDRLSDVGIGKRVTELSESGVSPEEIDAASETDAQDEAKSQVTDSDSVKEYEDASETDSSYDMPAFNASKIVDGVTVKVSADEGVFPAGAVLSVSKVSDAVSEKIESAVDDIRSDEKYVADSYTFDIKVLGADGTELQPADGQSVKVEFTTGEVSNQNLDTDVYHIPEESGVLEAEKLTATESGNTVTATSDGFSYYTVEFTYDEKQYVMQGDSEVALVDILFFVGITKADGSAATSSDISAVSVSNEELFSAANEGGEWMVTAHQAFSTDEWMNVTVDRVDYVITVTDAINVSYQEATWDGTKVVYSTKTATATPLTSSTTSLGNGWYVVDSDVSFNDERIIINGTVYLILCDGCTLTSRKGITLDSGNSLYIYGQTEGSGTIDSYSPDDGYGRPAIGGDSHKDAGNLLIHGGNIFAVSEKGCGIGGAGNNPGYSGGNVTIYGGSVRAIAGFLGAGIGSNSMGSSGGTVTIYGGTVYAQGAKNSPTLATSVRSSSGIGGGGGSGYCRDSDKEEYGAGADVNIFGGTVEAVGGGENNYYNQSIARGYSIGCGGNSSDHKSLNIAAGATITTGTSPDDSSVAYTSFVGGAYSDDRTYYMKIEYLHTHDWTYTADDNIITAHCNNDGCGLGDQTLTLYQPSDKKYDGNSIDVPTITPSDGWTTANDLIDPNDLSVSISPENSANVGTYTASVTVGDAKATTSWTISKASSTVPTLTTYMEAYDGNAHSITVAGGSGGTIKYSTDKDTWTTEKPTRTDAGTTTVYAKVVGDDNHEDSKVTSADIIISQKEVGLEWDDTLFTYDGNPHKPTATATGLVNNDSISVTVTGGQTNVGDYTATATELTGTKAGNYKLPSENTQSFSISNAPMTGVSATGYSGTYDAAGHGITVTAPDGAIVKYRTASSGDYDLEANPTFTDVGKYTVYYQVTKTNYEPGTGSATVQIDPKVLTLNWSSDNKFTYNGSPQAPAASVEGVMDNDDCTVCVSGAETYYSADDYTATAYLVGADIGNYVLPNNKTTTFTIGKKDAKITAIDQEITYGETITSGVGQAGSDDLVEGDELTSVTLTPSTSNAVTNGHITPSAAIIKKGTTDVTGNYNISYDDGSLTINKKLITISGITASDKTYDGTTEAELNYSGINWADGGRVEGDSDSDLYVTATGAFVDANVGDDKAVIITDLSLAGTKSDNYRLDVPAISEDQTSTTADITAKAITITADDDTKVYDGTALTNDSYSVAVTGESGTALASGDTIESVTVTGSQTVVGESDNVPSAAVIKNSSGDDVTTNYAITYSNGKLEVTQKSVTITADSSTKVYDGTALTKNSYTNTDLATGDSVESVTVTGSQTKVGTSDNVPSAAVIRNASGEDVTASYTIRYVNGTLEVTNQTVTITADSASKTYDGTALTKDSYTSEGLASGDIIESVTVTGSQTVAGSSNNVPSAAVIKNAAGEDVTASYTIRYVNGTLTVTKKQLTITAGGDTKIYDGTALTKDCYTNGDLAFGDTIESLTVTGSQTVAGTSNNVPSAAVIKNTAGDDVTSSYEITYANGTLEVAPKPITITADSDSKIYDGTALTKYSYSSSGADGTGDVLARGDSIESVTVTGSQTAAGSSDNVPSAAVIKNGSDEDVTESYDITYVNGELKVTPKAVTVTTVDATKIYSEDDPEFEYTVDGMIGDETLEGISLEREAGEDVGEYQISATSDDTKDTNYEITIENDGILTINPKDAPTPTVEAIENQIYTGDEVKPTVVLKDGDKIIPETEYTVEYIDNVEPGTAKVIIKDVDGGNYVIGTIETSFIIIDPGMIDVIEPETANANGAKLADDEEDVISKIELSDEDIEAIMNGKNIHIFLEVKDISSSVSEADKKLITDAMKGDALANGTIGMYLDINLYKQIEGEEKVKITSTNGKIKISFEIPESLRAEGRSYYIIRVHDGVATVITPTVNGSTLTFETDQFSTYALAYVDKKDSTDQKETEVKTPAKETDKTSDGSKVKTGDTAPVIPVMIVMIITLVGAVLTFIRKRKSQ